MSDLKTMTERELQAIVVDFRQSDDVIEEAKSLLRKAYLAKLQQEVAEFRSATPVFAALTADLSRLIATIKRNPAGDALARVTGLLDMAGDAYRVAAGLPDERPSAAVEDETEALAPVIEDAPPALAEAPAAPMPGQVRASTSFSQIADEYDVMFEAAAIAPAKQALVANACEMMLATQGRYEAAVAGTRIPWWFVAVIHGLESSFNFARHLHNGDPLDRRTTHVPANRPLSGDPPFTWEESAKDAMSLKGFDERTDWSRPSVLYRLECYNGLGYRKKGLASPYLWSFTDRYIRGKYVADGQFDPNAESKQVGAAAALKHLREQGLIAL
jgi:lysozyme family protein